MGQVAHALQDISLGKEAGAETHLLQLQDLHNTYPDTKGQTLPGNQCFTWYKLSCESSKSLGFE